MKNKTSDSNPIAPSSAQINIKAIITTIGLTNIAEYKL